MLSKKDFEEVVQAILIQSEHQTRNAGRHERFHRTAPKTSA
jgi:hypothetical protein